MSAMSTRLTARKMLWQEMTWPEIKEAAEVGAMVVFPTGSIEQHGAHLPVNTDMNQAWEIAVRAAERIREFPVLVAPPMWAGYSPHHMMFPGTLTLSPETFIRVVFELCASMLQHGFRKIVILSGHGGNDALLYVASSEIAAKLGIRVPVVQWWGSFVPELYELLESEPPGAMHSGEIETSMQLFLAPDLVHMEQAVKGHLEQPTSFIHHDLREAGPRGVYLPQYMDQDTNSGVEGDATLGTAEKGARMLDMVISQFVRFLREFWEVAESLERREM